MTFRRDLVRILSEHSRSASSIARELGVDRREVEDHLNHAIRSARAGGHRVIVEPARCRQCGFTFSEDKLSKPGKCPECHGARLFEAQIRIERHDMGGKEE
jgi:predicted Zn-ribbon and HTH transcriptional regulator